MIGMDLERIEAVARILERVSRRLRPYTFDDPALYPSTSDREVVTSFFLAMVAIDHRTRGRGRVFEACIGGRRLVGSELLYYLGREALERDPEFFSAERLARISADDVRRWLSYGGATIWDPEVRAYLLRDLGTKLLKLFRGEASRIIDESRGALRGSGTEPGLLDLLRVFRAYEDPVEKKSMLLAKILERRGIAEFRDSHSKRVAVDNHIARIGLRLGIVRLGGELWKLVREGREVSVEMDVLIRMCLREAWFEVSKRSGIDPFLLDDALWTFGREVCLWGSPRCFECSHPLCFEGSCPFKDLCLVRRLGVFNEHTCWSTWYY